MGVFRRAEQGRPLPRPEALNQWQGFWVAVRDGSVVTAAGTSRELVHKLALMGADGRGAVIQKVAGATDEIIVGMG